MSGIVRYDAALFGSWGRGRWRPGPPSRIGGVSTDTRTLAEHDAFLALSGPSFDGHDFVRTAFERGASCAVVRRNWAIPSSVADKPLLRVTDPLAALQQIAGQYRASMRAEVIAVTGSVGKTTVKEMIADVLGRARRTHRSYLNRNNHIGVPLSLLGMDACTEAGVFEVGTSGPGEVVPLAALLRPDLGIVTNVGPVHLAAFGSLDAVAREKAGLLAAVAAGGVSVLDCEQSHFGLLREKAAGRILTVSMGAPADFIGQIVCAAEGTVRVVAREEEAVFPLRVGLPGEHNIRNALFAVAVGRVYGVGWDQIGAALAERLRLPMRWEKVTVAGFKIVNDAYNANPISMRAAVRAFGEGAGRDRKWLVLGTMLELGAQARAEHVALGREVAGGGWTGLLGVGEGGKWIVEGALAAGFKPGAVFECADAGEAAGSLRARARAGDAVLLKASRGVRLEQMLDVLAGRIN